MSQAKVDRYKEEKANRKSIMKKEKAKHFGRLVAVWAVCLICIGYIGFSAYNSVTSSKGTEYSEINLDALTTYMDTVE